MYLSNPHFTEEGLRAREPHGRTGTRAQTSDSNPSFVKLRGIFKVPRVPFPAPAMVLAQAGLGMWVETVGGWGQGCSHKALQACEEQEMAPSDCPSWGNGLGLEAGS